MINFLDQHILLIMAALLVIFWVLIEAHSKMNNHAARERFRDPTGLYTLSHSTAQICMNCKHGKETDDIANRQCLVKGLMYAKIKNVAEGCSSWDRNQ